MRSLKETAEKVSPVRHGVSLRRAVFLVLFGALGAYLLGTVAYGILDFLFRFITLNAIKPKDDPGHYGGNQIASTLPFAVLGAILGSFVGDRVLSVVKHAGRLWDKMDVGDKVNVFLGAFAGLVGSAPFLMVLLNIPLDSLYKGIVIAAVIIGISALCIYALQSMAEVLPWSRLSGKNRRSGIKLLDTNVIIDGRIYDVARSGFLEGEIYVAGFVLDELQYIADSHDALRRQRGRRGLEVLRHMQSDFPLEVRIHDRLAPDNGDGVDARLVRLAKALGADIVTNDFNLNRVAALQEIKVLNLNDLSLALRPNVLPQETLELTLIREGNQAGQGVGYLEDGTMVVVENGKPFIGATMEVVVTQVIQTERGKMIFGKVDNTDEIRYEPPAPPQSTRRQPRRIGGNG